MPPTPEQLLINQVSPAFDVKGPQVAEQITNPQFTAEGEVSMPAPNNWIGKINYGLDWNSIGAKAFETASVIYKSVLDYGLRRRQEFASEDLTTLQQLADEASPNTSNINELISWEQDRKKRVNDVYRKALERQGVDSQTIEQAINPDRDKPEVKFSDFQMPASDSENLIRLSRFVKLTQTDNDNRINKLKVLDVSNLVNGIRNELNNGFVGTNPEANPEEIRRNVGMWVSNLRQKTEELDPIKDSSLRKAATDITDDIETELPSILKRSLNKELNKAKETFVKTMSLTDSREEQEKITLNFIEEIDKQYGSLKAVIDNEPAAYPILEEHIREELKQDPNRWFDFKLNSYRSLQEADIKILQQIADINEPTEEARLEKLQELSLIRETNAKRMVDLEEELVKFNPYYLSQENQQLQGRVISQYENSVANRAQNRITQITEENKQFQTLKQEEIKAFVAEETQKLINENDINAREIDQGIDILTDLRVKLDLTDRYPTKKEFFNFIKAPLGMENISDTISEEEMAKVLPSSLKAIFEFLPSNAKTGRNQKPQTPAQFKAAVKDKIFREQCLKRGICLAEDGSLTAVDDVALAIGSEFIKRRNPTESATKHVGLEANSTKTKEELKEENLTFKVMDSDGNVDERDAIDHTTKKINNIVEGIPDPSSGTIFKITPNQNTLRILSERFGTSEAKERFLDAWLSGKTEINKIDLDKWVKESEQILLTDTYVSPGKEQYNFDRTNSLIRFMRWASRKIPSGEELEARGAGKINGKSLMAEFTMFDQSYQIALNKLREFTSTTDGIKRITTLQQGIALLAKQGGGPFTAEGKAAIEYLRSLNPNGDNIFEAYIGTIAPSLVGGATTWDTTVIKNVLANSTEAQSLFTPIVLALSVSPPNASQEDVLALAKQFEGTSGIVIKLKPNKQQEQTLVISSDYMNRESKDMKPYSTKNPDFPYSVSPMVALREQLGQRVWNGTPPGMTMDGKRTQFTDRQLDKDYMYRMVLGGLNGQYTIDDLKQNPDLSSLIEGLFEVYGDQNRGMTPEERLQYLVQKPEIQDWLYSKQTDRTTLGPTAASKYRWLKGHLANPNLTATPFFEIGLNHETNYSDDPDSADQTRVWRDLTQFDIELTRDSMFKNTIELQPQSPTGFHRLPDGTQIAADVYNEPVIFTDPTTNKPLMLGDSLDGLPIGMNSAWQDNFNPMHFVDSVTKSGYSVEIVTDKGQVETIPAGKFELNKRRQIETNIFETISYDQNSQTFIKTTEILTGETGWQTSSSFIKVNRLIPMDQKKERTEQGLRSIDEEFKRNMMSFNPEGSGYDMNTAKTAGMKPDNSGHWGSVVEASLEDKRRYGLPKESYLILKGKEHKTWDLMEKAENDRGFRVIKKGDRYYSVPNAYEYSKKETTQETNQESINSRELDYGQFTFRNNETILNAYTKIYGEKLAKELIDSAQVAQALSKDKNMENELNIGRYQAVMPDYTKQNQETPIYETNKPIDSGNTIAVFDGNKNSILMGKEAGSEILIHELTHSIQNFNTTPKKNLFISDLPNEAYKKLILDKEGKETDLNKYDYFSYLLSPRELPAHIAEYKAEYFKETNRYIDRKNIEKELPNFIKWLEEKSQNDSRGKKMFLYILKGSKDSPLYKLFVETMKQVALKNTNNNNTRIA